MFACKTILILLSVIALIDGQQNSTEDYADISGIDMNDNTTQSYFQSDSLLFNESTETLETALKDSTETVELLESSSSENDESESVTDFMYTVDSDDTMGTIDEYIDNGNYSDETKKYVNNTQFSCYGRQFGQYADVDKDCRVFHMCYPSKDSDSGQLMFQRITFLCDSDSVFDQQNLICAPNSTLTHLCIDSVKYYRQSNNRFLTGILNQLRAFVNTKSDYEANDGIITAKKSTNPLWIWN
jgi:hypothetical protein